MPTTDGTLAIHIKIIKNTKQEQKFEAHQQQVSSNA
jgi:hypothetical protein